MIWKTKTNAANAPERGAVARARVWEPTRIAAARGLVQNATATAVVVRAKVRGANDMICPIVKAPNSILNGVCIDIEIGPHTYASEIAKDLIDTCYANAGAGLAAPQIHCALRIIVIRDDNGYAVMCNPEIVRRGKQVDRELEGCLSLPGQRFVVERNRIITVQWRDLNNNLHEQVMKGHPARVVQHEIDHLDGVLIG